MISRRGLNAALLLGLITLWPLACGGGGTLTTYAPCTAVDTCPSSTTCESPTATSTSVGYGPTFCTWSCGSSDGGTPSCPNDANGFEGICVGSLDSTEFGVPFGFGFCFQGCASGGTCPVGEACESAQSFSGDEEALVCVPGVNR